MTLDDRLVDLLLLADDLRQQGHEVSPEELCRDCPDLLPALRRLWRGTDAVEKLLHAAPSGACAKDTPTYDGLVSAPPQLCGYRVYHELGRGGMGVVYEAEQISLGRRVALKILPLGRLHDGQALERFRREARAAARLHHSNIVPVFEVGQEGDTCYYAMQLIVGQGLDKVVKELQRLRAHVSTRPGAAAEIAHSLWTDQFRAENLATPRSSDLPALGEPQTIDEVLSLPGSKAGAASIPSLPGNIPWAAIGSGRSHYPASVAHIGQQVALALAYAHARGIIHRDIKPSNLLLDAAGVVWVTDFGLAKTDDDPLTYTGDILGTFRYMAPERFQGECDARADIYALGTTLYELLALRPAFDAPDRFHLIDQVKNQEPPRLRSMDPSIPRDLETIVHKAMDKDPARRYASADMLAEDLRRFLQDEPIYARPVTVREQVWRWCRRNPAVASLTAAVFLTLAVAAATASGAYLKTTWALNQEAAQRQEAERQKGLARRARYLTDMQLAGELWQSDDGTARAVRDLLEAHLPQEGEEDLRDFVWRYQWNLLHRQAVLFEGHQGPVVQGAFAPDGRLITVDSEHQLRVWDSAQRQAAFTLDLTAVPGLWRVDLANDGKMVAIGTTRGTVSLLEPTTGQELRVLSVDRGRPVAVRFLGNSSTLLTVSRDDTGQEWRTATRERVKTVHRPKEDHFSDLCLSPDGTLWVTRTGPAKQYVQLWDSHTGTLRTTLRDARVAGTANSFAFAPDGKIAASGTFGGQLALWNLATGEATSGFPLHAGTISQLAFSPNSSRVASGGQDGLISVLDLAAPRRIPPRRLKGHTGEISFLAFSPDGNTLASGSSDGTARLWNLTLPAEGRLLNKGVQPLPLAYSSDGRWLAVAPMRSRKALLLDARTGELLRTFGAPEDEDAEEQPKPPRVFCVAFSPDGTTLAAGDDLSRIRLWEVASGRLQGTLVARPPKPSDPLLQGVGWQGIASLAFSADGAVLAAGLGEPSDHDLNYAQIVQLWDVHSGQEITTLEGHRSTIPALAFDSKGRHLVTASHDRTVRLWEVSTRRLLRTWTGPSMFKTVAFTPNGHMVAAGCCDGMIYRWDVDTGQALPPFTGHSGIVNGLAFSPDGTMLASASWDRTVRLWDVASGRDLRLLKWPGNGGMRSVAFRPDGNTVAATALGGNLVVWEAASPEAVATGLMEQHAREAAAHTRELRYLRTWLTLDPIPLASAQTTTDGLEAELIPDEAHLQPHQGDVIEVGDQKQEWQENQDADPIFGRILDAKYLGAHRVAYGVCYLHAKEEIPKLRLSLRSEDEPAKVYLNGQPVLVHRPDGNTARGQPSATIALARGTNVLVVKIVNKRRMWRWCLELTDQAGQPASKVQMRDQP